MKKGILFLNTSILGGAERSAIFQANLLKEISLKYIIPYLESEDECDELKNFILEQGGSPEQIILVHVSKRYYALSRKKKNYNLLIPLWGYIETIWKLNRQHFFDVDLWWLNGNKIAFLFLVYANLIRFKGKVVWHFRDYPSHKKIFKTFIFFNRVIKKFKLTILGNSQSVKQNLLDIAPKDCVDYIYNPIGEKIVVDQKKSGVSTIGIVAMFSPWKGIHQIIMMASLYETELKEQGISKIKIFGGDIYQTDGAHNNYTKQLQELLNKFPSSLISFEGRCKPSDIFSSIDLLIHCSVEKEPFGRVLLEAFQAKIPVISSSLGGAAELTGKQERALTYHVNDYSHLYSQIKETIVMADKTDTRVMNAYQYSLEIEESISSRLNKVLID